MTTQALSGLNGAFYRDDPTDASVVFNQIALTDLGAHTSWRAALGYRYWVTCTMIEKQVHHTGSWIDITSSCTVDLLTGTITTAALNADDYVRATGTRRDEANFFKLFNLYNGTLTWDQKTIDTTSCEDAGWESSLQGVKSYDFSADTYFYRDVSHEYLDLRDMGVVLLAKLYSYATGNLAWIGYGQITNNTLVLVSMNKAQTKRITFKGDGELFPEMGA